MIHLLVLDNDINIGKCVEKALSDWGTDQFLYLGQCTVSSEAQEVIEREHVDVLMISDYYFEKELSDALENGHLPFFLVTSLDMYYENKLKETPDWIRFSFLKKPFSIKSIRTGLRLIKDEVISKAPPSDTASERMQYIENYIREHLDEEIKLDKLSDLIHYSNSYLSRKFRDYSGKSLNVYIRDLRVERAKALLETTSYTVSEIAEMSGIPKLNTFGIVFKAATGLSPSAYRSRYFIHKSAAIQAGVSQEKPPAPGRQGRRRA